MSRVVIPRAIFAVLTLALMCGCGLVDGGNDARIVLGDNIDDVRIGDDTMAVIRKLGRPDHIAIGDFDGVIYQYTTGAHAGMSITIWYVAPI